MPIKVLPRAQVGGPDAPALASPNFAQSPNTAPGRQLQALGGAVGEVAGQVLHVATLLKSERDTAKTKQAFNDWNRSVVEIMENPETGYLTTTQGGSAVGAPRAQALEAIQKRRDEILKGLDDDVQRGKFAEAVDARMPGILENAYAHEAKHLRAFNVAQTGIMAEGAAEAAVNAFVSGDVDPVVIAGAAVAAQAQDPKSLRGKTYAQAKIDEQPMPANTFRKMWNTAVDQAGELAELNGFPKGTPAHDRAVLVATSKMHAGIVSRLLAQGQNSRAKSYVDSVNQDEVTAEAYDAMLTTTKRASLADAGAAFADEVVRSVDQRFMPKMAADLGRTVSSAEVFGGDAYRAGVEAIDEQFRKDGDSEKRRIAMAEFEASMTRRRHAWADNAQEAMLRAETVLGQDPNMSVDSPDFPAEVHRQLAIHGKLDDARKLQGGRPAASSRAALSRLFEAVDSGRMRGMKLSELFGEFYTDLSPTDWNEAQAFHAAANKPGTKPPHTSVLSDTERMKMAAKRAGIISRFEGPKNEGERERFGLFLEEAQKRINRLEGKGVGLDDELLQAVADSIVLEPKSTLPGMWTDSQKWDWELTPEEQTEAVRTTWGEQIRIAKGRGEDATAWLRLFDDAKAPRPDLGKLAWLASRIPASDIKRTFEATQKAIQFNAQATGKPPATLDADAIRRVWQTLYAPKEPVDEVRDLYLQQAETFANHGLDPTKGFREQNR